MHPRFRFPPLKLALEGEGGAGGGAPGGVPGSTPPGGGQPGGAPAAGTGAPAIAWLADVNDPETIGHVQASGWQAPLDAVKSHRELQKLLGADRAGRTFTLPKDDADVEGHKAFRSKIGVPDSPAAYELPVPQGVDGKFAEAAAQWMHKAGIPKKAAQALATEWNGYLAGQAAAAQQAEQQQLATEHAQLAADWGAAAESQREIAKRAAVKLGLDEAAIDALQKVSGYSKTLKALAKVGELMGEHKALGLDQPGTFGMTPESALAIRNAKMRDPDWSAKAAKGTGPEYDELLRLNDLIARAQAAQMQAGANV